ncbi:MAG: lamin tail domain-containing protein [Planctomycetes bacterium]|nr:lamin tail domain-containing protein [Planctomycetota bacterium]
MLHTKFATLVAVVAASPLFCQNQVADTQFSVGRSLQSAPFDLVLSTATPGATIRYTLNCGDPRTATLWAEGPSPLTVRIDPLSTNAGLRPLTPAVVIRAYAYKTGMLPTNVDTHTYVFVDRVVQQTRPAGFPTQVWFDMDQNVVNSPLYSGRIRADLAAIPSMSVVGEHAQIFGSNGVLFAANSSIEVPGSIEVMHPNGRDDAARCGLTPHSWTQNKRSIRVYFRASYGDDKWRHDLFRDSAEGAGSGVTSFDGLVLRAGFNDGILYNEPARQGRYSFSVDEMGRSSQIAMTGFGPRGMFVHLYLNGCYWGLYNPVERPESGFWSDWFGGDKQDYFARNHGGTVDGNPSWFNGLIASATNWTNVQARLEVPSFCDYILYWTICGGGDWPSTGGGNNNWYAGNRMLPTPGKVRFWVWDCEDSWINLPNRPGQPLDGARICPDLLSGGYDISQLWRGVQQQIDFRVAFADRVYRHCYNDGALSEKNCLDRWNRITNVVDRLVVGESARWGRFDPRGVTWTRNNDWVPYANAVRNMFVGNTPQLVAALRNTFVPVSHPRLYPLIEPPLFRSTNRTIDVTAATVATGTQVDMVRAGLTGTIWYTLDGTDPRAPGGAAQGISAGTGTTLVIQNPTMLKARTFDGSEWSALHELALDVASLPMLDIHEVLAQNVNGIVDEAGDHDDWLELHNRGLFDIDASGWHLTDDPAVPTKWTLPVGSIVPAGGTLLVWCDNELEGPLHANFRLSGLGETVALFLPGGQTEVDRLVFGVQRDDESTGRLGTDPSLLVTFPRPSPRRPNRPVPSGHMSFSALDASQDPLPMRGLGVPSLGDNLRYELGGLPGAGTGLLGIGLTARHQAMPGLGVLLVDPLLILIATADATGEAKFSLSLPDAAVARGAVVYAQGGAALPAGVQLSNAVLSRLNQ